MRRSVPIVIVLVLAGCVSSDPPAGGDVQDAALGDENPADAPADTPGDPAVGDPAVGDPTPVDPAVAARLQAILDEYLVFAREPGLSLAVKLPGDSMWGGAAGVADLAAAKPMEFDSGFRVGSNTKPYVVVAVLQLAEEGRLAIDDPISKHVPGYPAWDDITLRQLMGMRSGIPDYLSDFAFWADVLADPGRTFAPADLLGYAAKKPLDFAPGQGCAYSNTGYVLLGMVIEKVTGRKAADELRDRIVSPLGLSRTFLDEGGEHEYLARGYADPALIRMITGAPMDVSALIPKEFMVGGLADLTDLYHPSLAWTAGAVVSTTRDAVEFVRALVRGELLGRESMDAMMAFGPCDLLGGKVQYGLGMIRYDTALGTAYGHGGLFLGYEANAYYVPDLDVAVSDLHNFVPAQWTAMVPEVLKAVTGAQGTTSEACRPPEGLFEPQPAEPWMEVRFRGTLASAADPAPAPGIGSVLARADGSDVRLSGLSLSAKVAVATGKRVEIDSSGPGPGGEAALRSSIVSVQAGAFDAAGADGILTSAEAGPWALFAATADVALEEGTLKVAKLCFTAVADPVREWRLATCRPEDFPIEVGATVKLFGSIPMTSDPAVIDGTLKVLGMSRCLCPDGKGGWTACEPPAGGG